MVRIVISCRCIDLPDDCVRLEVATALKHNVRIMPVLLRGAVT